MSDEYLDEVKQSVRSWTRSPTTRTPAIARARVLAGLGEPRRLSLLGLATVATAVIGLAAALLFVARPSPSDPAVQATSATASRLPRQSIVVYELSSGTKLYLTLSESAIASPQRGQGEGS
jgi:hypothetical protein